MRSWDDEFRDSINANHRTVDILGIEWDPADVLWEIDQDHYIDEFHSFCRHYSCENCGGDHGVERGIREDFNGICDACNQAEEQAEAERERDNDNEVQS